MFNRTSRGLRPNLPPPPAPTMQPPAPPPPPPPDPFWQRQKLQAHLASILQNVALLKSIGDELEAIQTLERRSSEAGHDSGLLRTASDGIVSSEQASSSAAGRAMDASISSASKELLLETVQENLAVWPESAYFATRAARQLLGTLKNQLGPLQSVLDGTAGSECILAAKKLARQRKKVKRNRKRRSRIRRSAAEAARKERELFEVVDRETDEWMLREIAKGITKRKMEKMKELAEKTSKEEKARREEEVEMGLLVEKLQELRALRILKLKKQGRFFPEEDDQFIERVRAAVEEEERQAAAAANTSAATAAILNAEEARKAALVAGRVSEHVEEVDRQDLEDPASTKELPELGTEKDDSSADVSKGSAKIDEGKTTVPSSKEGGTGLSRGYEGLPAEFHHYFFGSSFDMGTLIEVRQKWDAFIMPGGSRIPQHWIEAPQPADPVWASYLVKKRKGKKWRRDTV